VTELALLLFFPTLLAAAAVSDLLTMTISNRISILLIAGFFFMAGIVGLPWNVIGLHVVCGLGMLALTFTMFAMRWMGGGDAKLASATALWFGFGGLLDFAIFTAIAGGLLTFGLLKAREYPLPRFASEWPWLQRLHNPVSGIPYGIALAAGALITYPHTDLWRQAVTG
jgi:prepilin peptidase CpaA